MLNLDDISSPFDTKQEQEQELGVAVKGFLGTHKSIPIHNTHVRRIFHKITNGQLNAILLGTDGFGVKMEWSGNYLLITPGLVNHKMPEDTLYLGHASFWKREEDKKRVQAEQSKKKRVEKIEEMSSKLINQAQEDEII